MQPPDRKSSRAQPNDADAAAAESLRALIDNVDLSKLTEAECWWRDRQGWLAERGYMLRPRYRPGWEPSWKDDDDLSLDAEDSYSALRAFLLDAVRISDNSLVMLKRVKKSWNPFEVELHTYLCSDTLRSDPRNCTVPLLDVLDVPNDDDEIILVMPLLRACWDPPWQTVGEVLSFIQQVFDGILFMHELHIAHRDCQAYNIMYDPRPMYPKMFHPRVTHKARDWRGEAKHTTRTRDPVKYYLIDFGLSRKFDPNDGPPRELPIRGGDKSVPEFKNWKGEPLDPFPTDIYYLGNMVRMAVLRHLRGVDFLVPLLKDMVQEDPAKRPTIQEVVRRFDDAVKSLSRWKLRSRLVHRKEGRVETFALDVAHVVRTAGYILTRKRSIPRPL